MKNKKMIYKILSLLLILSITLNSFNISSSATGNEAKIDSGTLNKLNEHIKQTLPGYLKANNFFGFEATVSEPMIINKLDESNSDYESYLYFVFNDETIIGKMTLSEYNGEIYSSFDMGNMEAINEVYNTEVMVAFGSYDDCLIMQANSETTVLYGNETEDILEEILIQENTALISEVDTTIFKAALPTRGTNIQLNAPLITNITMNGMGICWAACIASKVRTHFGNSIVNGISLSKENGAKNIYNLLNVPASLLGPTGSDATVKDGYKYFNINVTIVSSMPATSVSSILGQYKPIQINMGNSTESHAVVISGISYDSTGGVYTLMDPSASDSYVSSRISVDAVISGNNYIYAAPNGKVYTTWEKSYY